MADIRIKDLPTTATQTASDDFIALDGTVNGTRKIDASSPSFKTSVTSPSIVAPTTTSLTLTGGSSGASLVLGQSTTGGATLTVGSATTPALTISGAASPLIRTWSAGGARQGFEAFIAGAVRAEWTVHAGTGEVRMGGMTSGGYFPTFWSNGTEDMRISMGHNVLIGTTTDISGAGNLAVAGGTVTAGAAATNLTLSGGASGASLVLATPAASVANIVLTPKGTGSNQPLTIGNNGFGGNWTVLHGGTSSPASTNYMVASDGTSTIINTPVSGGSLFFRQGGTTKMTMAATSGDFSIASTTASTSTTSGALQVAGGVGVGGAGYFGGDILAGQSTATNGIRISASAISNESSVFFRDVGTTTSALAALSGNQSYTILNAPTGGTLYLRRGNDSAAGLTFNGTTAAFGSGAIVTVVNTTASTNTTSGALVVTGGVGVGGAVNVGGAAAFGSAVTVTSQVNLPNGPIVMSNGRQFTQSWNSTTLKIRDDSAGVEVWNYTAGTGISFASAVITGSATLSGAGAIPITTSLVKFTSTGAAQALTLANGVDGQRLTIVHDVDGGSGVLTPTTKTGFTTVTFTNAGDTVSLVYVTTRGWMVTGSYLATIA